MVFMVTHLTGEDRDPAGCWRGSERHICQIVSQIDGCEGQGAILVLRQSLTLGSAGLEPLF